MRKLLSGNIVSKSSAQTAVVEVVNWKTHRIFKKRYKTNKRYLVHNPEDKFELGQSVVIAPTRPLSKLKHWQIESAVDKNSTKRKKDK